MVTRNRKIADSQSFTEDTVATMLTEEYLPGDSVFTQGYDAAGDGGGAKYLISATDDDGQNLAIINGTYALIQAGGFVLNVLQFGVKKDSLTNNNAALLDVFTYAAAITGASGAGSGAAVFFPSGGYAMNNIDWPQHVSVLGEEVRLVSFFFDGAESAGSTVLTCSNGQSFAKIQSLSIIGYMPGGTALAENLIRFEDGTIDMNFAIDDIAFQGCKYNAIHQENGQWVNFHIDRTRFNAVGGYGIRLKTFLGHESRPFSLNRFTVDNNPGGLPPAYAYEARWGLGLFRAIDGGHNTSVGTINITDGRLEKNAPYKNTTYGDYTTGETVSSIILEGNSSAGAGQYKLDIKDIIVTGSSNIDTGEAFAASVGYTSSSAVTVNAQHCALATSDGFVYVDNHDAKLNLPATVINMSAKTKFEKTFIRARRSSDQTGIATGGSPKIIEFNYENIDSLGEFDISTNAGRFTPDREGWYRITGQVKVDAGVAGANFIIYIQNNGINWTSSLHVFVDTGGVTIPFADVLFLDATDYIEIGVYQNTGSNRTLKATDTYINIERILE